MHRNLLTAILLFALILCLCSCSNEVSGNTASEKDDKILSDSEIFSSIGASEIEPENSYVYLGEADGIKLYEKEVKTDRTHLGLVNNICKKIGELDYVEEIPTVEYWIVDEQGNALIGHPFYDFALYHNDNPPSVGIFGCYEGNYYRYIFANGKFELSENTEAGIYPYQSDERERNRYEDYGYVPTYYAYGRFDGRYGISDRDGNVIFEPVFSYIVSVPFDDRFVGTIAEDMQDLAERFTCLFDEEKNILCKYTTIYFHKFEDESYIGLAYYSCYGNNFGQALYNENGEILETGYRFIDKNGNELSSAFITTDIDIFAITYNRFFEEYLDYLISATDADGNAVEVKASDYICKP